jgi:protein phosphatase
MRDNNEDAVAVDPSVGLALLADGMGGYNAGEVASGLAINAIKTELAQWLTVAGQSASIARLRQAILNSVVRANGLILRSALAQAAYAGMGTTLVVAVFHDSQLVLGHLGDSRCYRLRRGHLELITRDHSVLQERIDAGLITPAQAFGSPDRNLVTRALGVAPEAVLELHDFPVEPGDLYLMCSDGLSDMVRDDMIQTVLSQALPLEETARALIALANEQGGRDNITVVLVQASQRGARRNFLSRLLGR